MIGWIIIAVLYTIFRKRGHSRPKALVLGFGSYIVVPIVLSLGLISALEIGEQLPYLSLGVEQLIDKMTTSPPPSVIKSQETSRTDAQVGGGYFDRVVAGDDRTTCDEIGRSVIESEFTSTVSDSFLIEHAACSGGDKGLALVSGCNEPIDQSLAETGPEPGEAWVGCSVMVINGGIDDFVLTPADFSLTDIEGTRYPFSLVASVMGGESALRAQGLAPGGNPVIGLVTFAIPEALEPPFLLAWEPGINGEALEPLWIVVDRLIELPDILSSPNNNRRDDNYESESGLDDYYGSEYISPDNSDTPDDYYGSEYLEPVDATRDHESTAERTSNGDGSRATDEEIVAYCANGPLHAAGKRVELAGDTAIYHEPNMVPVMGGQSFIGDMTSDIVEKGTRVEITGPFVERGVCDVWPVHYQTDEGIFENGYVHEWDLIAGSYTSSG